MSSIPDELWPWIRGEPSTDSPAMRTVRSVATALLILAACAGPRLPPPRLIPLAEVKAPPIPDALPATDPSLLAVVRVREPLEVAQRLGISAGKLSAMIPGFDARAVHAGTLAAFLWEPPPGRGEMPSLLGLLPTASGGSLAQALRSRFRTLHVEPFGEDTLLAPEAEPVKRGLIADPSLRALTTAPMPDDLQLYVNLKSVLRRYGEGLRRTIDQAQASPAARAKGQQVDPSRFAKMWLGILRDLDTLTFGARVMPDSFLFSLVVRGKMPRPNATSHLLVSPDRVRY
jgi:hypothetical protein